MMSHASNPEIGFTDPVNSLPRRGGRVDHEHMVHNALAGLNWFMTRRTVRQVDIFTSIFNGDF